MTGSSFLNRMASASRERVRLARAQESEAALQTRAMATADPPILQLGEFDLIAELKLRSPAAGSLVDPHFDRHSQLDAYANGGAAAISVLTEPDEFKGSLAHLQEAAAVLAPHGIPVMRKDFLIDAYQVLEAKAAGAGGILVIVTMLTDAEVQALLACARECGLFVLLEAFTAEDLARIAALAGVGPAAADAPLLCGVNCRDLKSLAVDFDRFAALAAYLPEGLTAVAESGVQGVDQIRALVLLGYRAVLVGSILMQSAEPGQAVARLIAAGTERRAEMRACS